MTIVWVAALLGLCPAIFVLEAEMKSKALLAILFTALTMGSTPLVLAQKGTWEMLGKRTVKHRAERDEIRVTAKDGTFRKIKLRVLQRPVSFIDVKVHYANGAVQDIPLRKRIRAGGETRVIDLQGRNRVIEKVVFYYETDTVRRGKRAQVQLWGFH